MSRWNDVGLRWRADRLESRGETAYQAGDLRSAKASFDAALELRRRRSDRSEAVASSLNWLGRVAQDEGDFADAQGRFTAALAAADHDRSAEAGNSWNNLGRLEFARGRLDAAESCYANARESFEQSNVDGDPRPSVATVLNNLGAVYDARGDLDAALATYVKALDLARPGNSAMAITCLNNIGGIHHAKGEFIEAADAFASALSIAEELGRPAEGAVVMGNIGHLRFDEGEIDEALTCYRAALDVVVAVAGPDSPGAADQHSAIARALLANGEIDLAIEHARRAEGIDAERAPGSSGHARDVALMAAIAQATGDLAGALRMNLEALAMRQEISPESIGVANALSNVGVIYHDRGDLLRALDHYEQALALHQRIAEHSTGTATLHNNAGAAARALGDVPRALEHYRIALDIDRATAPHSPLTAVDLSNLGTLHCINGDIASGLRYFQEAAEIDENAAPDSLAAAAAYANLAWAQLHSGAVDAAEAGLDRALRIDEALAPRSDRMVNDLTLIADVYRERGRHDDELGCLRRAAEIVELLRWRSGTTPNAREQALAERHRALHRLTTALVYGVGRADPAARKALVDESFRVADRARGRVLAEMIAENGIRSHSSRHDAAVPLLAAERRLRAQLAVTFTPSRSESANGGLVRAATDVREQRRIEDELEHLGEQLRALEPADERLVGPAETSVKDLRAVLAAGEQLIAYTVTAEAVLAWVCTELALEVLALPVEPADLAALVARSRDALDNPLADDGSTTALTDLAKAVLWPLLGQLVPERLIIVPDGPLAVVPWDCLPLPGGDLLLDRSVVSTVPSAAVLAQLRLNRQSLPAPSFVGFGAPVGGVVEPVPATRTELRRIADLFTTGAGAAADALIFLGADVTRSTVVSQVPGRRYVHFATHGVLNDINPLFSGLLISSDDGEGDLFAAYELLDLQLNAEVATCSACDTGLGTIRPGEGLVGLSRALFAAGARSVVLTLAPVPDATTVRLMRRFYTHLLSGSAPAEALTMAKRDLRASHPEIFRIPRTWAPFQLLGAG